MGWEQIGVLIAGVAVLIFIWPKAAHMMKHSRKGSSKEWLNVGLLIGGVVLFVVLLIKMV